MTITTVKRRRTARLARRPHASTLRLAPLAVAAMLLAAPCHADWRVSPTFSLTETYSDNVALQRDELAQGQFVTELAPGLAVLGKGARYQVAASGEWRHFVYNNEKLPNTVDHQFQYAVNGKGELARDLLFIEASAAAAPQGVSAFGPQPGDNRYSAENRTQIKTWRISPYLTQRFGSSADLSLRYARDSVDAGKLNRFGSSESDSVSASLVSGAAFRTVGWGLSYMQQEIDNELTGPSSTKTLVSNLRYRLNPRLALTATMGYDRYDYQSLGGRTAGRSWSAGFDWQPSLRTSLAASIGRHYFGNTGALQARHRSRSTVWSISYGDEVTTTRQQFLLPSAIDTAAMLDNLFRTRIPDPVLRQQAVEAYIRAAGLPPSLANDVNYLSNRFMRQKELQASAAFTLPRSTAVLALYRSERIALSTQQSDSSLLGSQLLSLNDNVRQLGASLTYGYRLGPRTSLNAAANAARNRSLTTGIEQDTRSLRLGLVRELGRNVRAALDLRRVSGSVGVGVNAGEYQENAISASLSAQL